MFVKVIDDFLTKSYHEDMEELITGPNFDWYYNPNISYVEDDPYSTDIIRDTTKYFNNYGFAHSFVHEEFGLTNTPHSFFIKSLLYQIMDVANCDFVLRARADMVTWSRENFIHQPHIDFAVSNIATVFYINDSDGDTILYNIKPDDVPKDKELKEYDRISPKANRLVMFDGDLLHTGCSPTKHRNRILINSNYIKSKNVEEFKKFYSTELPAWK